MSARSDQSGLQFFDAVSTVQRFVCAFQEGRLLRPSLSKLLPVMKTETERLALDGLLFALGNRLDRRHELSRLVRHTDLAGAVEVLARRRLREQRGKVDLGPIVSRLCLRDVAHDQGISVDTLRRRVAKASGMPPRELRQRQRVCRAIELIRSGMKIESAAHESGYRSERGFYAAFEKLTGMSPATVRHLSTEDTIALKERVLPSAPAGAAYQSVGL